MKVVPLDPRTVAQLHESGLPDTYDVLRQLLHNAVDAGATRVRADLGDELVVEDNGEGIHPASLLLVGRPHHSLRVLGTAIGFRGDFLHRLGAVLCVEIWSAVAGGDMGAIAIRYGERTLPPPTPAHPRHSFTRVRVSGMYHRMPPRAAQARAAALLPARVRQVVLEVCVSSGLSVELSMLGEDTVIGGLVARVVEQVWGVRLLRQVSATAGRLSATWHILDLPAPKPLHLVVLNRVVLCDPRVTLYVSRVVGLLPSVLEVSAPYAFLDSIQDPSKRVLESVHTEELLALLVSMESRWRQVTGHQTLPRKRTPKRTPTRVVPLPSPVHTLPHFSHTREVLTPDILATARVVGQSHRCFVVFVARPHEQLVLYAADQHACDERVRFEQLWDEVLADQNPTPVSIAFRVVAHERELLENASEAWGLWQVLYSISKGVCTVKGLPPVLARREPAAQHVKACLLAHAHALEAGRALATHNELNAPQWIHDTLASAACRAAIKFNQAVPRAELARLLARLARCRRPFRCAHGRPTVAVLRPT